VRTPADVDALRHAEPAPFVLETIQRVRKEIPDRALIGFAGAPFTLAAYLIEGGASKGFAETKRFCYHHPDAWARLMTLCARVARDHLRAQVEAGCDAVQLFDTWAEALAPDEYERYALPYVRQALDGAPAPTIYFARGTPHLLPLLPQTGAAVWSTDWRVPLESIRARFPGVPLQGNLDPTLLFAPRDLLAAETRAMLDALGGRAHIANLGHGILPGTPIEGVRTFVETVTTWTA
jgi:uroporphyrinogen decarboxylase